MIVSAFSFILAYLLTNFLEFFPLHFLLSNKPKKKIFALFTVNSITLPIVWFVIIAFYSHYILVFIAMELFAVVAETFLIKILLKQPALASFKAAIAMNLLSAAFGFFVL